MNDKEMIEEMAEIIYGNRPNKDIWIEDATEIAKVLLSAGYRKPLEGSVVLTIEEVDEFRKDSAEVKFLKNKIIEQARKETAKEIYRKLTELSENPCNSREEIYKEVFGQYGVEVEE